MIGSQITPLLVVFDISLAVSGSEVIRKLPVVEILSFFVSVKTKFTNLCGDTIVSPGSVITAAHCLFHFQSKK